MPLSPPVTSATVIVLAKQSWAGDCQEFHSRPSEGSLAASPRLLSIATAPPPHRVAQYDAKAEARAMFRGRTALFDRLSGVFDNAGIDERSTVAPIEWYRGDHGWADRNALYLAASEAMVEDVARVAIARAGLKPTDIDGFVMVSTT